MRYKVIFGDCKQVLNARYRANTFDAVVTDPPYGLGFMGKEWDHGVPGVPFWTAIRRTAKPGAYLLAFGGTRTFHRLACAIEDAGWEIRDCVMWVYGTGFPKSLDISKAIDKAAGAERPIVGFSKQQQQQRTPKLHDRSYGKYKGQSGWIEGPVTPDAKRWDGWGTALKPAWEPIIVARKPLEGTVAANCLKHGCGALNIDGCRVPVLQPVQKAAGKPGFGAGRDDGYVKGTGRLYDAPGDRGHGHRRKRASQFAMTARSSSLLGRWPANLIHDGSDEVLEAFAAFGDRGGDSGTAARFFYCAKASRSERNAGLDGLPEQNTHPTVKPVALMRYLVRLVTPPNGLVLDPFMGSGSTGKACGLESFRFVGIDNDDNVISIAWRRVKSGFVGRRP